MDDLISCGERRVQKQGRVAIKDMLDNNNIKEGDIIEVFLKKVTHVQK